ncbi:hypothetical protein ACFROC_02855 [Nocardia tengchongensis]|uniref:hypothetical protein n=1 Tax=Nocardia tengchongensis TaxID=2055889 RepID=UPI0036C7BD1A
MQTGDEDVDAAVAREDLREQFVRGRSHQIGHVHPMKVHRPVGPVLTGILHDNLDHLANSEMSVTFRAWTLSIRAISAVFGLLQPRISILCGAGEPIVECGGNQGAVIAPHSHFGSSDRGQPWTTPESMPASPPPERRIVLGSRVDRPADSSNPPGPSSNTVSVDDGTM